MSTNYDQPDDTYSPADDDATIARIEAYEAACVDGEITVDDIMPDPDAVDVRIGCDRDNEAEECPTCGGRGNLIGQPTPTSAASCPTCGGSGTADKMTLRMLARRGETPTTCPTCHGTGVK